MPQKKAHDLPKVGTVFEKRYKKTFHRLTIVKTEGGVGFKVAGKTFRTPTGAAKSITGSDVNGWMWWGIEGK